MDELFEASSNFTEHAQRLSKRRCNGNSLPFRVKIAGWLEQASMHPGCYDYDPAAYSVEEWEAYLLKKNNRMTFAQFLRRPRWSLSKYSHPRLGLDMFRETLRTAQEKADEFLSEAQLGYVDALLAEIESARKELEEAYQKIINLERSGASKEDLNEARHATTMLRREIKFMCKFKITLRRPLPPCVHEDIIERLMEQIAFRKFQLNRYRRENSIAYDPEQCPTFRVITKYNLFTPEEIDRAMALSNISLTANELASMSNHGK